MKYLFILALVICVKNSPAQTTNEFTFINNYKYVCLDTKVKTNGAYLKKRDAKLSSLTLKYLNSLGIPAYATPEQIPKEALPGEILTLNIRCTLSYTGFHSYRVSQKIIFSCENKNMFEKNYEKVIFSMSALFGKKYFKIFKKRNPELAQFKYTYITTR